MAETTNIRYSPWEICQTGAKHQETLTADTHMQLETWMSHIAACGTWQKKDQNTLHQLIVV